MEHVSRGGSTLWCDWYVTPTKDGAGDVTGVAALVLDVTQKLRVEDAFRDAEERFEQLFRAMPIPIGISRVHDNMLLDLNDAAERLFGYRRHDVIGRRASDLGMFNDPDARARAMDHFARGEPIVGELVQLRAQFGEIRTVLYSLVPVTLGGERCGLWACVDVTERERMQVELQRSHALKATIVDASHDAILVFDDAGHVIEWNATATRLLGWTREQVIGRSIADVVTTHDGRVPECLAPRRDAHANGRVRDTNDRMALALRTRDGEVVQVELTVVSMPVALGTAHTVAISDISARYQLSQERATQHADLERRVDERTAALAQSNERLREVDQLKNRFLAMVSHELRTPLTSILGYSELLQQPATGPLLPVQEQHVRYVHTAASELLRLINDLLDLSRVESGRLSLGKECVNISDVLLAVEVLLAPEVARKGLVYTTTLPSSLAKRTIVSDAHRVRQILLNVAGNAVKYTDHGNITVTARLDDEGGVVVSVSDTGCGIAPDRMPQLFQPFSSLQRDRGTHSHSTGLGLYLVKRLLGLLGGRVDVASVLGEGSCFTIWLPAELPLVASTPMFEGSASWQ
jgi:PAS domain S-box-containing protein